MNLELRHLELGGLTTAQSQTLYCLAVRSCDSSASVRFFAPSIRETRIEHGVGHLASRAKYPIRDYDESVVGIFAQACEMKYHLIEIPLAGARPIDIDRARRALEAARERLPGTDSIDIVLTG